MLRKKRILIFIDWYFPGYKAGGPVRSCANLVDNLKEKFDFSIVTRNTDYCEVNPYSSIKSDSWNLKEGTRIFYFSKENLTKANIKNIIKKEQYDFVYFNGIYSPYFTLLPLYYLKKRKFKNIIVATRGMLAASAINVKRKKKTLFLAAAKLTGLFKKVTFHATTEHEIEDIQKHFGKRSKIIYAPNLPKRKNITASIIPKEKGKLKLVNVARISPEKNLKYALEVLQKTKANITFDIYGPIYNNEYWNECQELIYGMPASVEVNYRNSLSPGEVSDTLAKNHFMFMPTRGENFGHIILEALSAGCPVIISDQTPWKDLEDQKAGFDLPLNDIQGFVNVTERCAGMSQYEYDEWRINAQKLASGFIQNEQTLELNLRLFS